ncbi:MAG: histidine kinase [Bacteroidetes bacterium GWF2_33_38]|nr:MAG: histidine kinase [Bacteroidetes bacterium GWF2_33_38]OFY74840.1 MAG: histidine kinase [Bacteroidetes bacterium RIFOXYA12_FULL_33_9]OFY85908.1 MAG: histidine kinase [Bacteroidetes bacterium RIFOXYA2_FULL_33_7]
MNIYSKKFYWKLSLFIIAILIGISSMWYTSVLIKKLSIEERKKVELWAEGMKQLASPDNNDSNLNFVFEVVRKNETVPVILTDADENVLYARNIDSLKLDDENYLKTQIKIMKEQNPPIEINIEEGIVQRIYYRDSILLQRLFYYPFIQLGVIFLFILVAYLAFSSSRRAEQNQVWVGLSKETAHQLGTPISSLLAWVELLKLKETDQSIIAEVDKDVKRLEVITERFSKIGSSPKLTPIDIYESLLKSITYLKTRSSSKIKFQTNFNETQKLLVPINNALFEWVIENISKNAIDAMEGKGDLDFTITDNTQVVYLDIKDSGKGIAKSKYKTIFNPGYTTKERGWGLGLSLSKRIIEQYHSGKIFVKNSEINKGTTFRIVLHK